jgi:hypothetical protein
MFFNLIGLGMFIAAFAIGAISHAFTSNPGVQLLIGALAAAAMDLYFRAANGDKHWFHWRAGGHMGFIPIWIWAIPLSLGGLIAAAAPEHPKRKPWKPPTQQAIHVLPTSDNFRCRITLAL